MKPFSGLRHRIGEYILNNKMKEIVRFKEYNNFTSSKSIGVIFNATKLDAFYLARDFIVDLRKKSINTVGMGYALTREAADFFGNNQEKYEKGIDVFSVNNVNWFFKPNNPLTDEFCNQEFDILIDMSMGHDLPLRYIVGLSRAKMKIGNADAENPYYDFTIRMSENNPKDYIKQITHYLDSIQVRS